MKSKLMRMVCRLLVVSMVLLPFETVQAGMIGAGQVAAAASAQSDRAAVMGLISRVDVARQMQSLGLDSQVAKDRVAAMTDQEVQTLAGHINSLPAGASSNNGWAWAAVIIIAIVIWYNWR